jgi:hypothetical protein
MACTPGGADLGAAYPTSHDCPPASSTLIGNVPFPFALTSGITSWTATPATNDTEVEPNQARVFCGYCRDADITGLFQSPAKLCWTNGMAAGSACTQPNETCEQRTMGAFGPNGGAVRTITTVGAAAGSLVDHAPHAGTLTSVFCVQPLYDPLADAALDLPGPAAVSLRGTIQIQ